MNKQISNWIASILALIALVITLIAVNSKAATEDIRENTFTAAEQIEVLTFQNGIAIDSFTSIAGTASDSSSTNDSINWRFNVTYDSTKYTRWLLKVLYANETEVIPVWHDPPPLVFAASATISLADKQEIGGLANDSVTAHHGPGAYDSSSLGAGEFSITFFTIDTSAATDDSLSGIPVFIANLTGSQVTDGITGDDGGITLKIDVGTWIVSAATNVTRWAFDDTVIVVTGLDTFGIQGYETAGPTPSGPTQGPIWGDVFAILGNVPQDSVIVELRFATTTNVTASGAGVIYGSVIGFDTTDATGRFSFDAPISVQLDDTTLYMVTGRYQKRQTFSIDSLFNPVGGVNITDSIAAR